MFVALDANCNKVDVDDADPKKIYYCPFCHEELTQKRGAVRIHHFAHKQDSNCPYNTEPKGPWHLTWQREWPTKFREIIFFNDGEWRISDIAIRDLSVEFQNSSILFPEIYARNNHYRNLPKPREVVWVWNRIKKPIQELIHCWKTETRYKPSGYFCAPKDWWVKGAIAEKWEMMAFDYGYAVVILTGWMTKDELNCETADNVSNTDILNIAKYALVLSREDFIKLINARAKATKKNWSFETYVKSNGMSLLTSGINALKYGNPSINFRNAEVAAKNLYGQYVLSSIPSWEAINPYTFLNLNPKDVNSEAGITYAFVTDDLFCAYSTKDRDELDELKKEILSLETPPRVFSEIETLNVRKVDLSALFFSLIQKVCPEISTASKQNAIEMSKPKPLRENLKIIEAANENYKAYAKERAYKIEEETRKKAEEMKNRLKKLKAQSDFAGHYNYNNSSQALT